MDQTNLFQKLAPLGVAAFGAISVIGIFTTSSQAFTLTDSEFRDECTAAALGDPDCTIGDKTFSFVSASFAPRPGIVDPISGETIFDIVDVELIGGTDYIFTYDFIPDFLDETFTYVIDVDVTDPEKFFAEVDLDTTVDAFLPPSETLTANFVTNTNGVADDVTLISVNGGSAAENIPNARANMPTSIRVTNTYDRDPDNPAGQKLPGEISSFENSFRQDTKVPEPASMLGLLTIGGLGLGLKRKKES